MLRILGCVLLLSSLTIFSEERARAEEIAPKPIMNEFMGVCGHTVQFKPVLYKPACGLVRDYHPIDWDFGDNTSNQTHFPLAYNKVDWKEVYGGWKSGGFETDCCLMFDNIKAAKWKNMSADAKAYGMAFAKYFGPSGQNIVTSVEIGNEPGGFDDATYKTLFENMARGVREGDPKMKIATCAAVAGKSHKYAKSLSCFEGFTDLIDVVTLHTYAQAEPWPTWRRSYPEDPKIPYLKDVETVVAWREEHAKGKPVWITEFGWDASTKPAPAQGDFKKWKGNTEVEQARYLVRSFMVFARMPVERAYIYFFNDEDQPQMHGSSGLTRNFKPKPSFYAVAHLHKLLGEYRFSRVLQEKEGDVYVYEFVHGTDAHKRIWAVWSPTGSNRNAEATLPLNKANVVSAEQMPLEPGEASKIEIKKQDDSIVVPVQEAPIYIKIEVN